LTLPYERALLDAVTLSDGKGECRGVVSVGDNVVEAAQHGVDAPKEFQDAARLSRRR